MDQESRGDDLIGGDREREEKQNPVTRAAGQDSLGPPRSEAAADGPPVLIGAASRRRSSANQFTGRHTSTMTDA